jgi:cell shape-determining protein MreC
MSVVKSKRKPSKYQIYVNAIKLKSMIHDLCIRTLGIKSYDQLVRTKYYYKGKTYDAAKYAVEMNRAKNELHRLSDLLIYNTRTMYENKLDSSKYIQQALENCYMLTAKFQNIVDYFLVDINLYKTQLLLLREERELLKKLI